MNPLSRSDGAYCELRAESTLRFLSTCVTLRSAGWQTTSIQDTRPDPIFDSPHIGIFRTL